ncbi:hypothetical protein HIM_00258 [Hirsutella minnesotensis 3608]|nr:hypothetical protein HIM_00258 [Hirsutella minnesotensis 3608]
MQFASTALLLGSVAVQAVLGRLGSDRQPALLSRSVDSFVQIQQPIALQKLFCNIGPDGCNVKGVGPGAVIASPSTADPDYFFTWTRDSSLVFKVLVDRFINNYDAGLQKHIEQFIAAQARLQTTPNLSGSLSDGKGLAEPKFEANLTSFNGNWGRPQRDGPALRAITLITYANWLIQNDYTSTVSEIIWPIVRNDLNYVAQYWNQTGFDLWEEVEGSSFFTTSSQYRALVEGSSLATALGKPSETFSAVAPQVLCFLQSFWVPSGGYLDANINVNDGRAGKDVNTILGSIHNFDAKLDCEAATFQPCSDKALSNHKVTVDSFRSYKINQGASKGQAVAVGRYIEDVYYGGQPWYLATLAAAEQLYDAIYVWKKSGSITITDVSLGFFQDLVPGVAKGTHLSRSSTYAAILKAVSAYADGFVDVVASFTASDGSMAEQFSKDDGKPLSARDLTWSYAAFLTAADRRAGVLPPPWSGNGGKGVPSACSATSVVGSYSPPTATSFPPSQTPKAGLPSPTTTSSTTTTTSGDCKPAASVAVTFEQLVVTDFGQTVKIVGNNEALGNWNTDKAVALDASEYTPQRPLWKQTIPLVAGAVVEYKYIKVSRDGSRTWERDPNRTYTVPKSCATAAVRSDKWQF